MNPTISGPSVRAAREAAKLSQTTVAQSLGINRMYYSLFEAGRYVLDATELKRLRELFESHGIELENNDGDGAAPSSELPNRDNGLPEGTDEEDASAIIYNARVNPMTNVLSAIGETAEETGQDSKRTAAAVGAALTALQTLDYPELLALAELMDATIEGLPAPADFALLSVDQKQLWESRAIGMLICAELYQDNWTESPCKDFKRAADAIQKLARSSDWNVRESGFWETDEKYRPDLRCQLAPYIARAAEQRRAPILGQSASGA